MQGRYVNVAGRAAEAASYIRPEILAISNARMKQFLASAALAPYRLLLERLLRYKPHTLGKKEEKLLAMQTEMAQAVGQVFRQLNDADMKFGTIKNERGQRIELSHATFSALLHSPRRSVRKAAFHQYYRPLRRPPAHAGRDAGRLGAARHLLRPGAQPPQRAGGGAVSRPRAGVGVRQPDRQRPPPPARRASLLRRAAAEDAAGRHPPLRHLRADPGRAADAAHLGPGRGRGAGRAGAAGQRLLRHAGARAVGPLVRPLREPRQAERRLQRRLLRRRPLHPHELPARRARPRLHAGPRGGPLDAQLLLGQAPALHLLQLHDLRGRGGQHVQRATPEPASARPAPATTSSGRF